jgi:hypothetical protein
MPKRLPLSQQFLTLETLESSAASWTTLQWPTPKWSQLFQQPLALELDSPIPRKTSQKSS